MTPGSTPYLERRSHSRAARAPIVAHARINAREVEMFQPGSDCGQCRSREAIPPIPPDRIGSQGCPEGTAPEEWICNMNISVRTLMHQGGAAEALPRQFPESFPGFILFCEVTNQNANAHYLSFTHYVV